ncbi:Histone acetyltransferase HPA2-related acetyltransferase [Candidatus Sodalis pierantonius str. SOPE]|uniref:Histone acetyltransferase HPA2-related acetyltransferase n=1 Tax=Candidatus Sodalis pierantonii str. SOPE TaxID=2342 RepID=W0HQJ4_9GAMM|nr:GNAT family N-acetyltransferase [Candidatus Sodalis pierantonius]AHF74455.1 Histone acetyltransferase HPA2-related acetyltransferase [Candidatus Sodalis pierantonius str. SOPE]
MITIRARTVTDSPPLVALWERSVRASHHFLRETDIDALRTLVAEEGQHGLRGFIGLSDNHVEMLFIEAAARCGGIGQRLLDYAVALSGDLTLDVNEQNHQALGFYQHYGFVQTGRSEVDAQGNSFPLLHMQWQKR